MRRCGKLKNHHSDARTALGVPDAGVRGMSVPLLRETRMPAVLVEVGPASTVVEQAPALAAAISAALGHWADASWE